MVVYLIIKVYWDSTTILSGYQDFSINIPGAPPGWFRDQTAYVIFNFSSQGNVTLTHDPPQDGHRGLEHHDEHNHIGGFSLHEDTYPYPGQGPGP